MVTLALKDSLQEASDDNIQRLIVAYKASNVVFPFCSILKEKRESEQHGIRTAEKLLREFYPHSQEGQNQVEMLQSYCLMATKERHNVEKALHAFTEMAQNEVRKSETASGSSLHIAAKAFKVLPALV